MPRKRTAALTLLLWLSIPFSPLLLSQKPPDPVASKIYRLANELRSNLSVLTISLEPGAEDPGVLSYLRHGTGASVVNACVTNGESGEDDTQWLYPHQVAGKRREEAFSILTSLGAEAVFLNFPDFGSSADTSEILASWPADSFKVRIGKMISRHRPDLIVLFGDPGPDGPQSLRWRIVKDLVLDVMNTLRSGNDRLVIVGDRILDSWTTGRFVAEDAQGLAFPVGRRDPLSKSTHAEIGKELGRQLVSLSVQHADWQLRRPSMYAVQGVPDKRKRSSPDDGLPAHLPASLAPTGAELRGIANSLASAFEKSGAIPTRDRRRALGRVVSVMDSISRSIARFAELTNREKRLVLRWKEVLEDLRVSLMGVEVFHRFADTVLTARQLIEFTVDSVRGLPDTGTTELFFTGLDKGWIVDEGPEARLPLRTRVPYRLISPSVVDLNLPAGINGLDHERYASEFMLFVLHRGSTRATSFMHRIRQPILFAPRFICEVETPLIRAVPNERVAFRLRNTSRDGVTDAVVIDDSLATSAPRRFLLAGKDAVHADTLVLQFRETLEEGTYLLPISIGGVQVGNVAARKFRVDLGSRQAVGVVPSRKGSLLLESLRRLEVEADLISGAEDLRKEYGTVLVERRALALNKVSSSVKTALLRFAEEGGRLILFSQDTRSWQTDPWIPGLDLHGPAGVGPQAPVAVDSASLSAMHPNVLGDEAWDGWLFRRAYHTLKGEALSRAEVGLRADPTGVPLVLGWRYGNGTVLYVNAAIEPQLLNVHPGAFRLLANLLSFSLENFR